MTATHYPPQQTPKRSGLAITALIVGIIAFLIGWIPVLGLIVGIGAIIIAVIALVQKQSKGMSITGLILGAIATITSIAFTVGAFMIADTVLDKIEPTTTVEPTTEPSPEPTTEPEPEEMPAPEETEEPARPSDEERSASLEQTIKDLFGVESFTQLLAEDPTMWAGYIANVRVESTRAYITLQVSRDTPDGRELGERAAKALSTLLNSEDVQDISWIIVEDSTGVVIDQEQPNPLS